MPSEADLLDALTHSNPNESGAKEKEILGQFISPQGGQDLFIPSDEGEASFKQKQEERRRESFSYYPHPIRSVRRMRHTMIMSSFVSKPTIY